MKKIIFYTTAVLSIILIVNIAKIVITDLDRLTRYGTGYLAGNILLLCALASICFLTKKHRTAIK